MNEVEWAMAVIRLSVGLVMIVFGLHQLVRPQGWGGYVPGWAERALPVPMSHFMRTHGFSNLVLGLALAIGLFRPWIFWITLAWWVSILPFAFYKDWAAGLRDAAIIAALAALVILH